MVYLFLIIGLISADQAIKFLAVSFLKPISELEIIKNVLYLTYVENDGAAFGLFSSQKWILLGLTSIVILFAIIYLFRFGKGTTPLIQASLSLIIAGGIGNLIDRFVYSYVVDFIDFRIINFAVFNFADICISCGAALLVLALLKGEKI